MTSRSIEFDFSENGDTLISKTTKHERLRSKCLTLPHLDVPHISISP